MFFYRISEYQAKDITNHHILGFSHQSLNNNRSHNWMFWSHFLNIGFPFTYDCSLSWLDVKLASYKRLIKKCRIACLCNSKKHKLVHTHCASIIHISAYSWLYNIPKINSKPELIRILCKNQSKVS